MIGWCCCTKVRSEMFLTVCSVTCYSSKTSIYNPDTLWLFLILSDLLINMISNWFSLLNDHFCILAPSSHSVHAVTINFESVVRLEVTRRHLTQDREHVQEVIQCHVSLSVLWENLSDPLTERVVLDRGDTTASITAWLKNSSCRRMNCHCWIWWLPCATWFISHVWFFFVFLMRI